MNLSISPPKKKKKKVNESISLNELALEFKP